MPGPTSPTTPAVRTASRREDVTILERAFTNLGRAILKMKSDRIYGPAADHVDRTTYFALVVLEETGAMRLCELAALLGLDTSTVSRLVSQLTTGGMVERHRDERDGRAQRIEVTQRGRDVLREAGFARRTMLEEAIDGWEADDCHTLGVLMARLASDLRRLAERGAGALEPSEAGTWSARRESGRNR